MGKQQKNIKYTNLSDKPLIANIDKKGLKRLILLPDHSPGKGKLPVGSVAVYSKDEHVPSSEYLGPDIGCGMLLAKFKKRLNDLEYSAYNLASNLRTSKTEIGSLGGGNHFINFYEVIDSKITSLNEGDQMVLIHSGSRLMGKRTFEKGLKDSDYIREYKKSTEFGRKNRKKLLDLVKENTGISVQIVFDNVHNSLEVGNDFIYRKGAVKLKDKELGIIPSYMGGNAILITPQPSLEKLESSMCHGTGRKISRGESKKMDFNSSELRKKIYIPNFIYDDEIKSENPECYRKLRDILPSIKNFINIEGNLKQLTFIN